MRKGWVNDRTQFIDNHISPRGMLEKKQNQGATYRRIVARSPEPT